MKHEIIEGDCREVLAGMPAGSADMIFTDPPYGHRNNNDGDLIANWERALGREPEGEPEARPIANDGPEADEIFREILPVLEGCLSRGGCCCCCGGGGGPDPQFARWALWMKEVFLSKQMVVWDKGPMGMGWHYRRSYETVLVAQKRGGKCAWYDTSKKIENIIRPNADFGKIIPRRDQHPTEKPDGLAAYFIRLHTQPGETVLDPFCGYGSTGVACQRLGRNFIGIDVDAECCRIARERIGGAMPLFAGEQ